MTDEADEVEDVTVDDEVLAELLRLDSLDKLDPETIVAEATDPDNVLHNEFTWDDSEAAHEWRKHEARQLVRRFKVELTDEDGSRLTYRRFTHVKSTGRYHETDRALELYGGEILRQAERDLEVWRLRYQRLGAARQRAIVDGVLPVSD